MRRIILMTLVFLLIACTSTTSQNSSQTLTISTEQSETETSSLQETIPTATRVVTPSTVPLPSNFDLPDWMKSTDTEILAALIQNDMEKTRKIAFFNAADGSRYELELPRDIRGFFWYDHTNFGLLATDLKTIYQLNLSTGQVISDDVDPRSVRLLDPEWMNGLELVREGPNNQNFTFDDVWDVDHSKTKKFTADRKSDWTGIVVTDNTTNEAIWEFSPPIGIYATRYAWSPVDDNILAYIQGEYDSSSWITQAMTLTIVDVISGKVQGTYPGDFGRFYWSPEGNQILYQDEMSVYSNYGFGFIDPPCILSLETNITKCIVEIPRFVPPGYELATTDIYRWSADGRSISYVYLYSSPKDLSFQGNLCIYDLDNPSIYCPTQDLEKLKNKGVTGRLSPSEQYIHICVSTSTVLNDYAGSSEDGIIKVDGTGFFSWIGWLSNDGPDHHCSWDALWRPLP